MARHRKMKFKKITLQLLSLGASFLGYLSSSFVKRNREREIEYKRLVFNPSWFLNAINSFLIENMVIRGLKIIEPHFIYQNSKSNQTVFCQNRELQFMPLLETKNIDKLTCLLPKNTKIFLLEYKKSTLTSTKNIYAPQIRFPNIRQESLNIIIKPLEVEQL
jgi:hypothetical protein